MIGDITPSVRPDYLNASRFVFQYWQKQIGLMEAGPQGENRFMLYEHQDIRFGASHDLLKKFPLKRNARLVRHPPKIDHL
jgi:hypothetical protein